MYLYENDKRIKANLAFTIYFVLMCCFYTNTYIQIFAQMGILFYVFGGLLLEKKRVSKKKVSNLLFYFCWFGLFTLVIFCSKMWAYSTSSDSKTTLTVFRIFVIGVAIFFYVDCKEKAISIMLSFMIGCITMGVLALVTSYSAIGTTQFGAKIGQHRNQIGATSAALTGISYFFSKQYRFKNGKLLIIFFTLLTLITGSRSSILQIVLIFFLYVLFGRESISNKVKQISIFLFVGGFVVSVIYFVPFLYQNIWVRFVNAFLTVAGDEIADSSAQGRDYYKQIALYMFSQKPWIGYGVDGFKCFLRDNPYFVGVYLRPVYAHCNYAEIAADFGILGLITWYFPIFKVIVHWFKNRRRDCIILEIGCVFLSMVIFDYSRIPWETHLIMYLYMSVILLMKYLIMESSNINSGVRRDR